MSIADESAAPHRPPQLGDRVRIWIEGTVVNTDGGRVLVELDPDDTGTCCPVWRKAEETCVLRDVPRYKPGHADRPEFGDALTRKDDER